MDQDLIRVNEHLARVQAKIDALRAYKQKSNSKLIKDRIEQQIDQLQVEKQMWRRNADGLEKRIADEADNVRKTKKDKYKAKNLELGTVCGDVSCSVDSLCNFCLAEEMVAKDSATDEEIKTVLNL